MSTPLQQVAAHPRVKLLLDLEFIDCLANPFYLPTLCTGADPVLNQTTFLNYLDYLVYLKGPKYIHLVKFPHALYILDQLRTTEFRQTLFQRGQDPDFLTMLEQQLQNMVQYPPAATNRGSNGVSENSSKNTAVVTSGNTGT